MKHQLKSMTVLAAIVAILSFLKTQFGWDITESRLEELASAGLTLLGLVVMYASRIARGDLWLFSNPNKKKE